MLWIFVLPSQMVPAWINRASDRQQATQVTQELRPTWLIGSPPCTAFCWLNHSWKYPKLSPEDVEHRMAEGRIFVHFVVSLYQIQLAHGRHVLHEHPRSAGSWRTTPMRSLLLTPRVHVTKCHQCQHGLVPPYDYGVLLPALRPALLPAPAGSR